MVSQAVLDAIVAPTTRVYRRVDIYESDGVTPYYLSAPFLSGTVTVDMGRQERRMFDLVLDRKNANGLLNHSPAALWYDKIFKIYRGVILADGTIYSQQIGEFLIDTIKETRFPQTTSVAGRDYTKRMLTSKFAAATNFVSGSSPEYLISVMAANAGITKKLLPVSGKVTSGDQYFDRGTARFDASQKIADAFNYDLYFDLTGYLVMNPYVDPTTSAVTFSFTTGKCGTVAEYEKSSDDSQLYNHVAVTGEGAGQIPVVAEATNTEPTSPTRISKIGDRLYEYVSSFIYTTQQAQDVADRFLSIHALEQYDINLSTLVIPWLDVNTVIEFIDPAPNPGDPTRFLLTSMNIPLDLSPMTAVGKRITIVG